MYFGRAAVIGSGVSGYWASRLLLDYGNRVSIYDDGVFRYSISIHGIPVIHPARGQDYGGFDVVVPSPGVPRSFLERIRVPLISEVELGYRKLNREGSFLFGITGTNGKTTVTTLINHLLQREGAVMAGNVGRPLSSLKIDRGVFVLELSSFQLAINRRMRFDVGILLNISEDHLDWHGDMEHYISSKLRLFSSMKQTDSAVLNMDDPIVIQRTVNVRGRKFYFSLENTSADAYWVSDILFIMGEEIFNLKMLPEASRRMFSMIHNRYNLLASALAIYLFFMSRGVDPAEEVRNRLLSYLPSYTFAPHRLQYVGEINGVEFFNDSKATNPHAVLHALRTFERCILIMAGLTKGSDLSVLREEIERRVSHLIAIGGMCRSLREHGFSPLCVDNLEEAVEVALNLSRGEPVLFSPGGSSFDMFRNYAHRGEEFVRAFHRLKELN